MKFSLSIRFKKTYNILLSFEMKKCLNYFKEVETSIISLENASSYGQEPQQTYVELNNKNKMRKFDKKTNLISL